ncbi:sulfurtransferase [Porphyromonas gulae]|uniref:Sulfurtransferase n=2 Tax=Porphyromonas gulae TaxID=111105 RepID=A0A099WRA1_9PORP|nr:MULTISPECIES: rhodanese-like domain-containing protein [Porphyromonas]KGL47053.1 sulfurtransferase [Porphyromonas gulae]KGL54656.1 sulfurtransferase [Porphyromonas sp. COT-052 OH4946]KGN69445.1 sulfurtransferase [Porphyromonas gulae]KGN83666.1 sulfurtransferase [Porphyromonas gulae]KGN88140.1 sulfurtransferase [Porphyromonas gulae]
MSKQNIKKVISSSLTIIIAIVMLGLLKNLFSQPDDKALTEAIRNGAFLVDVRTPGEFASGSVSGAVNIPLDRIASRLDELKNKKTIIVFCRSGNRSSQAKSILERNGFTNVLNGGTWGHVASLKGDQR